MNKPLSEKVDIGENTCDVPDIKQALKDQKKNILGRLFESFKLLPAQLDLVEQIYNEEEKETMGSLADD